MSRFDAGANEIRPHHCGWFSRVPMALWSRVATLFLILCATKLVLVWGLSKSLFEVHWRVEIPELAPQGYVAFGLFVVLGTATLVKLALHCRSLEVRAVRMANAIILVLALLFIFLTSHNPKTNYLFPILTGILDWHSLGPYLSLDLFFHPPYLAGWLFVYALAYYFIARSGGEAWMLVVTGGFGFFYAVFCLRELALAGFDLWLLDGLGLASLIWMWRPESKRLSVWMAAPLCWIGFFAARMLVLIPGDLGAPLLYFLLLVLVSTVLFAGATLLSFQRGFGAAWAKVVFFYFASFLLLANSNYPSSINLSRLLSLGLGFPHYFLGELLLTVLAAALAIVYLKLRPRGSLWWFDALALTAIILALLDLRISQVMGTRLDWDLLALGNSPKIMWRMARSYLPGVLAGTVVLTLAYTFLLKTLQRLLAPASLVRVARTTPVFGTIHYVVAAFLALGLVGFMESNPDKAEGQVGLTLAQGNPLWKRAVNNSLKPEKFALTVQTLGLADIGKAAVKIPGEKRDLNVLLVFMESTYNQHLSLFSGSEETQPLLSKYKDRMELFPNFFSTFASSIHARFGTFTSLYPVQDYNAFTLHRVPVKSIFEVLHENGYSCSLFYSSFLDFTGFRNFLERRGLDEVYDADTMPGLRKTEPVSWGLREEETLRAMRARIRNYAKDKQRFFLTYVPAAPHYPYEKVPEQFHKFKPGELGDYSALYKNELLYMDWVMASLVDELKESGLLEKTIVIITDDHGELLGANGGPIGHGWLLTPELANAPLIIMDPQKPGYRVNTRIGSQVDLLPTLLDSLGIAAPAGELYQGRSLYSAEPADGRLLYLNTFQQYGIVSGNHLFIGDREREGKAIPNRAAYLITNVGARTIFSPVEPIGNPQISITAFDKFQANLLNNYFLYSKRMATGVTEIPKAKPGNSMKSQITESRF